MFEVDVMDSIGWIAIVPKIIYIVMIGLGFYISILTIKALRIYIKNNS